MTKKIVAKDIVEDIRSGVSDSELMHKYGITESGLQKLFRQLLDTNALTAAEFEAWSIFSNDAVPIHVRLHSRYRLDFMLPVYEAYCPENSGVVVSI